jgi:hypothetical protein
VIDRVVAANGAVVCTNGGVKSRRGSEGESLFVQLCDMWPDSCLLRIRGRYRAQVCRLESGIRFVFFVEN